MIGVNASPQRCRHREVEFFDIWGEKLPKKEEVKGPFPNQDEPSDHLPLHATLRALIGNLNPACRISLNWNIAMMLPNARLYLWKANQKAIRFCVSIIFDALPGPWNEMTKRALPNIPKQIVKSVVHTRPCTDPAFHTEPFYWLPDYLVIDSSSYIVACTPELAGLECCKHAISLKDYERKNEMFPCFLQSHWWFHLQFEIKHGEEVTGKSFKWFFQVVSSVP